MHLSRREEPNEPRLPRLLAWACGLACAAGFALLLDVPLARWLADGRAPKILAKLCALAEVFGHGLGVAVIAIAVVVLDPAARRYMLRVLCAAYGAGLLANIGKLLVARWRPGHFDMQGGVGDTLIRWAPGWSAGHAGQSFPSAHTATAVGLAIGLTWLYPRGRGLFAVLAILVIGQRMISGAHFLSDTLCGAAVGCMFAQTCLYGRLAPFFARREAMSPLAPAPELQSQPQPPLKKAG